MPIVFQEYRERITAVLQNKGFTIFDPQTQQGDYILLDKFINQPIYDQLTNDVVIGGPSIPIVVIVHVNTSEIKFFALKGLVSDIPLQ